MTGSGPGGAAKAVRRRLSRASSGPDKDPRLMAVDVTLTAAPAAPRSSRERAGAVRRRCAGCCRSPALVLLLIFFAGPILWSVYTAFTDQALTGARRRSTPQFIGLGNFRRMFDDPTFSQSLVLTVIFVVGSAVIGQNVARPDHRAAAAAPQRIVRAVVAPIVVGAWVMPEIVAAFCWYAFLDRGRLAQRAAWPRSGCVAELALHGADGRVILANVWRGTAFSMLVYSAALSDVPEELEEAAAVDGAGGVAAALVTSRCR